MIRARLFSFFAIIASFLFLATLFSPNFVYAEANNTFLKTQAALKKTTGLESWLGIGMDTNAAKLFNALVGDIPKEIFETGTTTTGYLKNYIPGGAFGTMNGMIASLNTPPASGIEYIAQVKDSFLGKPAYAQGVGFQGLQFLLPLWRGFRNTVYILASIIFIVIGLMIMLRVKISPQAVVTVQSAIPQLITTLILVTFSYAIAGLVIDLCNLIQALVVALLFSVKGVPLTDRLFPGWWAGTGFPGLSDIGNALGAALGEGKNFDFASLSNPNLHNLQQLTYRAAPGWFSMVLLGGLLGSIVLGFFLGGLGNVVLGSAGSTGLDMVGRVVGGGIGGLLGGLIIPIVLCIIVGIWLIKLYFGLLKNYVTLLFKIIFAPLEIAMGAFPNSKVGFTSWIMDVLANMAVFPIVGIFLVILNLVIDAIAGTNTGSSSLAGVVWAPSLISAATTGTDGGIQRSIIAAAVGLAGLALISKLPDMVPQFIFMIKPSPWGQAIGEGLDVHKMPVVGTVVRGTEREIEETIGKTVTSPLKLLLPKP